MSSTCTCLGRSVIVISPEYCQVGFDKDDDVRKVANSMIVHSQQKHNGGD